VTKQKKGMKPAEQALLVQTGRPSDRLPHPLLHLALSPCAGATGCRYLADERQTAYVRDGWNLTGDDFMRDTDGVFHFAARADDMIISSGYNIAGDEVEAALARTLRRRRMRGGGRARRRARPHRGGARGAARGLHGRRVVHQVAAGHDRALQVSALREVPRGAARDADRDDTEIQIEIVG
jgi:acyl-CoA synthetase (AMP-forming)/AMP-acid ligase II